MHTQQDLINLIGLKISDAKLIAHIDALGLKQPKSCTPNSRNSDVNDKANRVQYWFGYEVKHDACHPPKREGKPAKWATYLSSVSFVDEASILKKPDVKPASFWNASPQPSAGLDEVKAYFGEPTKTEAHVIYFCKKINDLVEINCQFSVKQQRAGAIWAAIIEERELISHLYFRDLAIGESDDYGSGMAEQNIQCMLVKWLHNNQYLNKAQDTDLPANKTAILAFVKQYFNGRIWQNNLLDQTRLFANFVSDGTYLTDENGIPIRYRFQEIALIALGKWDAYNQFEIDYNRLSDAGKTPTEKYWDQQEAFLKNIEINDANYQTFAKAIDDYYAKYTRLMQLKVNRDYYHFDSDSNN